jgi:hypothetical protein
METNTCRGGLGRGRPRSGHTCDTVVLMRLALCMKRTNEVYDMYLILGILRDISAA